MREPRQSNDDRASRMQIPDPRHPIDPNDPVTGVIPKVEYVDPGDEGYHQSLSNLQIQMIAIGGAIGVGLFLGIGARLQTAGPALVLSYLLVSVVIYLLMRALGELVIYRPTSGAFVSYAREFVSDRLAFMTGWIYVTLAAIAGVAEIAALAVYVAYWWPSVPGWIPSTLAALVIVGCNLVSVRVFGHIELWASAIKVLAILCFLAAGIILIALGTMGLGGATASAANLSNLWANGGFAPHGVMPLVIVMSGVVFSFSAIEIVGVSAGEAADPQEAMPRAINSVVLRLGLFYIGSILILSMLLPTDRYSGDESAFVTALTSLNIPGLAGIMNFVVLTAAISGVNATLYSAVRLLRNMASHGQAPHAIAALSPRGVPQGALLSVLAVYLLGICLIYFAGASHAFEVVLSACAVFILFGWISIFLSHLGFLKQVKDGRIARGRFRMPGAPVTDWVCLAFLLAVGLYMMFDLSNPTWYYSLIAGVVILAATTLGFEVSRRRLPQRG